ncbi:manganese efflux pump [bacterium]|nr:manganese efflux pump [bacterium]
MSLFEILLVAVSLAMDAFAVSIASGVTLKRCCVRNALKIAVFFGLFQAVMPLVGWLAGLTLKVYIEQVDHWIAFGLLAFIGIKMIVESNSLESCGTRHDPLAFGTLLMLSIATSIDALAVGLSLAILQVRLWLPVIVIGVVTFIVSFGGVYLGDRFGHFCGKTVERAGGLVLISIGIKILVEHLWF